MITWDFSNMVNKVFNNSCIPFLTIENSYRLLYNLGTLQTFYVGKLMIHTFKVMSDLKSINLSKLHSL